MAVQGLAQDLERDSGVALHVRNELLMPGQGVWAEVGKVDGILQP